MAQMAPTIRPLRTGDIPELPGINPSFATHEELALTREQFDLKRITWVLSQKRLDVPFDRGDRYDLGEEDLRAITERLRSGKCLQLVAETNGQWAGSGTCWWTVSTGGADWDAGSSSVLRPGAASAACGLSWPKPRPTMWQHAASTRPWALSREAWTTTTIATAMTPEQQKKWQSSGTSSSEVQRTA
jgi:hypothetical protein